MSVKKILATFYNIINIIVLIISFIYFFIGKLDVKGIAIIWFVSAITFVIYWNIDMIKIIKGKIGGQEILFEVEKVRDDIYAKVKTVRTLGEEVADLTAFNITRIGRFASKDLGEKMIEGRDKIVKFLQEIGSDREKVEKICSQINDTVLFDLKMDIHSEVQRITHKILTSGKQIDRDEIHNRVKELLKDYNRNSLIKYLKEEGIYKEQLITLLDKIDKFIKDKKL